MTLNVEPAVRLLHRIIDKRMDRRVPTDATLRFRLGTVDSVTANLFHCSVTFDGSSTGTPFVSVPAASFTIGAGDRVVVLERSDGARFVVGVYGKVAGALILPVLSAAPDVALDEQAMYQDRDGVTHLLDGTTGTDITIPGGGTDTDAVHAGDPAGTEVEGTFPDALTVRTAHSGSSHADAVAAAVAAADSYADAAVATHSADTTGVHGITDTSALVLTGDSRLTDARTPTAHHTSHEVAGTDAVAITHAQTTGKTANDHHNQSHAMSGSDHTGSVAAAQMPALTGDVTTSAGAVATTIAVRAVTAAKLFAATATNKFLMRKSAAGGDWEEGSASEAKTALAITTSDIGGLGTVATLASDTDGTLAANSDTRVATQKATKTYVDTAVTGLLDFKGTTDCSTNPNYPSASKGDSYVVSVAGKIGGASGKSVAIGDWYVATADNAGGTEASVGTSWVAFEHNIADLATVATTGSASDLGSGTLPAGRLPALTGDVTSSAGSAATTLAHGSAGNLDSGTLLAARMPALTGDVTTSAGAVATAIAARAVTAAKLFAASATSKILLRKTAGGGDWEEGSAADLKTIAGYYTSGDTPTFTGTNITGIPESGVTNLTTDLALKAPLASPTFTGTLTAAAVTATGKVTASGLMALGGTSFPASPATNDLFFRTDRGLLYYYDGTRWLTVNEYTNYLGLATVLEGGNTPTTIASAIDHGANGCWVTRIAATAYQATGNGSNYVTYQLNSITPAIVTHNIGASFNTSADTAGQVVLHTVTIGALVTAGDTLISLSGTLTGAPTGLQSHCTVFYRLVG